MMPTNSLFHWTRYHLEMKFLGACLVMKVPQQMIGGMKRMRPQGLPAYNLTSQARMGGGMNPGGIMQRGIPAQAHQ